MDRYIRSAVGVAADPISDIDVDSPAWREARARAADIRALIGNGKLSQSASAALAQQWGVSRATVWRRVASFRRESSIRAFLPRPRGAKPGVKMLGAAIENIIGEVARTWWRRSENCYPGKSLGNFHRSRRPHDFFYAEMDDYLKELQVKGERR